MPAGRWPGLKTNPQHFISPSPPDRFLVRSLCRRLVRRLVLAIRFGIELELGWGMRPLLAEDPKSHRQVAVEVLRPELAAVLGAERSLQEITTTADRRSIKCSWCCGSLTGSSTAATLRSRRTLGSRGFVRPWSAPAKRHGGTGKVGTTGPPTPGAP